MKQCLIPIILAASGMAHAVFFDLEPNNTVLTAQALNRPAGVFSDVGLMSLTAGDVDVISVQLFAGETFTAVATPTDNTQYTDPDTRMALIGPGGGIVQENDDSGPGFGSLVQFFVVIPGTYHVVVSGFSDFNYNGAHTQDGTYALTVSAVPEPATMAVLGLGLAAMLRRRKGSQM